jgi:hypothetical protein
MAYSTLEPFGSIVDDLHHGILIQLIHGALRGKGDAAKELRELLLCHHDPPEEDTTQDLWQQAKRLKRFS